MASVKSFTVNLDLEKKGFISGLQEAMGSFQGFSTAIKGAAAAFVGGKVFGTLVTDYMNYNSVLSNSTNLMKYNVQETDALGRVLHSLGGDTNTVINGLNSLNKGLTEAKFNKGALLEVSRLYGISFMKSNGAMMNAEELLRSLTSQMSRYDAQTRVAIMNQLGLEPPLQNAIALGTAELDRRIARQKQLNATTERDIQIAGTYETAWLELREAFGGLWKEISRGLLPILTKLMNMLTGIVMQLREWKADGILIFTLLTTTAGVFVRALWPILAMIGRILGATRVLSGAFGAFLRFLPLIANPITAAVTGVVLLVGAVRDLYYYFTGGKSAVGELIEKFPALKGVIEPLRPVVMKIKEAFDAILDLIKNPSWDSLSKVFEKIWELVTIVFNQTVDRIKSFLQTIGRYISKIPFINRIMGSDPQPMEVLPPEITTQNNAKSVVQNNTINQNINGASPNAVKNQTSAALHNSIDNMNIMVAR